MKKKMKHAVVYLLCGFLVTSAVTFVPGSVCQIESLAHSGRTDKNGGHRDNKNASGLGSYHYHCGGYPPHLHPDGVCPYSQSDTSRSSSAGGSTTDSGTDIPDTTKALQTGWQHDSNGWWYKLTEDTYYADGFVEIDGQTYYFNADGYVLIGWQQIDGIWYYFNSDGNMVTGTVNIDGIDYYFDSEGALAE